MAYGNYYGMNGYQPGYFNPTGAVPDALNQFKMPYQPQIPQQQPQPQSPQNNSGMIWVQGEAGAKSYLVAPGNTVLLMDSENCTFYLKTTDASGMPSMKTFDYSERVPQQTSKQIPVQQNSFDFNNYVTHEELEEKLAQISSIVCQKNTSEKNVKEKNENG